MSQEKKQDPNLMDFVFVGILLSACILIVWNTIQIQQTKKVAEYNKAHSCFLTDALYGPVPPESYTELCDQLRQDVYKSWKDWRDIGDTGN